MGQYLPLAAGYSVGVLTFFILCVFTGRKRESGISSPWAKRRLDLLIAFCLLAIMGAFWIRIFGCLQAGIPVLVLPLTCIFVERLRHARKRKRERAGFNRHLPLLLDFLVAQLESGHSLMQALNSAPTLFPENSRIHSGLERFHENMEMGNSLCSALEDLSRFSDSEEAFAVFSNLSQAVRHGTPLVEILRNQSSRLREKLLLEGENFANTLSIKLLLPLLFFIFPASFLVILSPVIVMLSKVIP